jgi:hypothetical protein
MSIVLWLGGKRGSCILGIQAWLLSSINSSGLSIDGTHGRMMNVCGSTDGIDSDRPCPPTGGVNCTSGWLGHGSLVGRGEWLELRQCSSKH